MLQSAWAILLAAVALPPLGLVLLWLRSGTPVRRKLLGSFAIAAWTVGYLALFFDLKLQRNGGGVPQPAFYNKEAHYAELERSRAAAPPVVPVSAEVEPAKKAEPKRGGSYWTDFRGPRRNGVYSEMAVGLEWPAKGLPQVWRQPIGGGYASFVVADGRAFTIEQRRRQEVTTAYDMATGRELWAHAWDGEFQESMGGDGPRATPTFHEGRVYSQGALGELRCLDAATGKRIWSRNILSDNGAENLQWGMSNSPLIVDDKVIVLPGGSSGKSVVAYNKLTGEPVWKALDDKQSYTSPMLVEIAGKRQILVVSASRAMGLEVENGALLWEYPWKTDYDINVSQPIVFGPFTSQTLPNKVFLSAGYGHGAAAFEVVLARGRFQVKELWTNHRMKNKFSSSVMFDGHVYGLDEAILACMNPDTGELKWKGGRYGYGQVAVVGGGVVVTSEEGEVVLVKTTPERHQELARFQAVSGRTWNHPAIADGLLLVRNATEMACFRLPAPK